MSDSIISNMLNDRVFETDKNCNDDNVHLYSEIADLRKQIDDLKEQKTKYLFEEKHLIALEVLIKYLADHENYDEAEDARLLLDNYIDECRDR